MYDDELDWFVDDLLAGLDEDQDVDDDVYSFSDDDDDGSNGGASSGYHVVLSYPPLTRRR